MLRAGTFRGFGSGIAEACAVPDRYHLRYAIVGMPSRNQDRRVITIPSGSIVESCSVLRIVRAVESWAVARDDRSGRGETTVFTSIHALE